MKIAGIERYVVDIASILSQSSESLRVIQEVRKPSDHRLLMVGFEFTTKSTKSMKRLIFHSSPSCSSCPSW
ncbi:MAG: hypothetical protein AUK47_12845 [Deltaproteobacteria bacterium CG2_30_63_29]|nr:MAG: hypothetical protein AUK47_12845 [Deltaproteobacteria bacterium CG2_30_63_29]